MKIEPVYLGIAAAVLAVIAIILLVIFLPSSEEKKTTTAKQVTTNAEESTVATGQTGGGEKSTTKGSTPNTTSATNTTCINSGTVANKDYIRYSSDCSRVEECYNCSECDKNCGANGDCFYSIFGKSGSECVCKNGYTGPSCGIAPSDGSSSINYAEYAGDNSKYESRCSGCKKAGGGNFCSLSGRGYCKKENCDTNGGYMPQYCGSGGCHCDCTGGYCRGPEGEDIKYLEDYAPNGALSCNYDANGAYNGGCPEPTTTQ
jgi:type II secretory pathway pseudopilin PulG